jgi:hypothetical protein
MLPPEYQRLPPTVAAADALDDPAFFAPYQAHLQRVCFG